MKKITVIMAVAMAIGLALAFTGCGSSGNDAADETTEPAAEETTAEAASDTSLASLPGNYQDTASQRATMTITADDDNEVEIKVTWSDSADTSTEWDMDATLQDGKLVYAECEKETKTYDENGKETSEAEAEEGAGYFEIDSQGSLLWTGAADENCRECVFVKTTE